MRLTYLPLHRNLISLRIMMTSLLLEERRNMCRPSNSFLRALLIWPPSKTSTMRNQRVPYTNLLPSTTRTLSPFRLVRLSPPQTKTQK